MHVTVCIVGFRNADDIKGCLAALSQSTHTDFDVVICDQLLDQVRPGADAVDVPGCDFDGLRWGRHAPSLPHFPRE